jgi:hypothetical protein
MLPTWTAVAACCFCEERFILYRVSIVELTTAVAIFRCPHCHRLPTVNNQHQILDLSVANLPFRKPKDGTVWHYSEYCSGWPASDFIELDFPPLADICPACKALVRT